MFQIARGESKSFTVSNIKDAAGVAIDLSLWRVYVTVRLNGAVIIEKKSALAGGGVAQIEFPAAGSFKVHFANADTTREPCEASIDGFIVKTSTNEHVQVIKPQTFQVTQAETRAFPV